MMTEGELQKEVECFLSRIMEHVDACQVMLTFQNHEGSHMHKNGCGNWFSRKGMAQHFIEEEQQDDLVFKIRQSEDNL